MDIASREKYSLSAIDLFSGCGGLTEGLRQAGFDVLAAIEMERKAVETYRLNHPHVSVYHDDIRNLDPMKVLLDLGMRRGELGLLAGCPPCQGFSRLRTKNRGGSVVDPRNDLVNEFLNHVTVFFPKCVMLENVPSLIKDDRFKALCDGLVELGFSLVSEVLDAADYGVPQRRKRLILLASRVHKPELSEISSERVTVRSALSILPSPSESNDSLHKMPEKRTQEVKKIISMIPKNGGSRSDLPVEFHLECYKRSGGFSDVYGRMAWDTVAPTITSGCHNPSKGRFLHPTHDRTVTLREAAILQGFRENYIFDTKHGKESIALMIGNALPPPFITAHAYNLKNALVS